MIHPSLLLVGSISATCAWAAPQCSVTTLPPSDPQGSDCFGCAGTLWGGTVVVGDSGHDFPGGYGNAGSAYVYERTPTGWVETAALRGNDLGHVRLFGCDLELWGDTLLVGAMRHSGYIGAYSSAGAVYFFERSGGTWPQTQRIVASDASNQAVFGRSVDMDTDVAVVGASGDTGWRGAAYVLERSGGFWSETQKLVASDATYSQNLGYAVAATRDALLAGAPDFGTGPGSAYVFERSLSGWAESAKLTASDGMPDDTFGRFVDIFGNTLVVAAPEHDTPVYNAGAVYVFEKIGGTWIETQKLQGSGIESSSRFGRRVALFEDSLLISSNDEVNVTYLFERVDGVWTESDRLTMPGWRVWPLDLEADRALVIGEFGNDAGLLELATRSGTSTCAATTNSSGTPAQLGARGNACLDVNCLELTATSVPSGEFGYFLLSSTQAFLPLFGASDGNLCVGLPVVRFARDILSSGAGNTMSFTPDLTALPQATVFAPGDTWTFQLWFRDAGGSNTSNGLALTFATGGAPTVQFPRTLESIVETTTQISVPVTLSQPTHEDVLVPYTTSGSATVDVDFRIESTNPLVLRAGTTSAELLVTVADDSLQETDETVTITLGPVTGATLGAQVGFTLTIADDD